MNYMNDDDRKLFKEPEYDEMDIPCIEDHSPTGMCPCCGAELEADTHFDEIIALYTHIQLCESCGWESVPTYE